MEDDFKIQPHNISLIVLVIENQTSLSEGAEGWWKAKATAFKIILLPTINNL